MSDLDLIRSLGTELGPPGHATPIEVRERVMTGISDRPAGIRVLPSVADVSGRPGVAVGVSHVTAITSVGSADSGAAISFDPTTNACLGTSASANLRQAIVDKAGQLP